MDWPFLTSLGSAALVWPLALALGMLLRPVAHLPAGVGRWWLALGLASALVALSKVMFYGWGTGVSAWDLTCFSGHATLAAAFWPVAFAALAGGSAGGRWIGAAAGLALAGAVATSRVVLHAHPVSEALAGWLLGAGVAMVGLRALGHARPSPGRSVLLTALMASALLMGLGHWVPHVPSEQWFQRLAVALSGRERPVDRRNWSVPASEGPLSNRIGSTEGAEYNVRLA